MWRMEFQKLASDHFCRWYCRQSGSGQLRATGRMSPISRNFTGSSNVRIFVWRLVFRELLNFQGANEIRIFWKCLRGHKSECENNVKCKFDGSGSLHPLNSPAWWAMWTHDHGAHKLQSDPSCFSRRDGSLVSLCFSRQNASNGDWYKIPAFHSSHINNDVH